MSTVIGVDLSLSATGLVAWRDGRFYVSTVYTNPNTPTVERHNTIVNHVLALILGPTVFVVEKRIDIKPTAEIVDGKAKVTGGMRGDSTLDLAELRGVVNYGIHKMGRHRVDVHPSTLKAYATGNGHAPKRAMVVAARGRLGEHLFVDNDNEADAAWLVAMALDHFGQPLCAMPAPNRRALGKPEWPEIAQLPWEVF